MQCFRAGKFYEYGHLVDTKQLERSPSNFFDGFNLVDGWEEPQPKRKYRKALRFYHRACDEGMTYACIKIGMMYNRGAGVEQNSETATNIFLEVCSAGSGYACFLAHRTLLASGDEEEALKWALYACETNYPTGCYGAARQLMSGDDYVVTEEALLLLKKGCDRGDGFSCSLYEELLGRE